MCSDIERLFKARLFSTNGKFVRLTNNARSENTSEKAINPILLRWTRPVSTCVHSSSIWCLTTATATGSSRPLSWQPLGQLFSLQNIFLSPSLPKVILFFKTLNPHFLSQNFKVGQSVDVHYPFAPVGPKGSP